MVKFKYLQFGPPATLQIVVSSTHRRHRGPVWVCITCMMYFLYLTEILQISFRPESLPVERWALWASAASYSPTKATKSQRGVGLHHGQPCLEVVVFPPAPHPYPRQCHSPT